jgi:hypothetical protein
MKIKRVECSLERPESDDNKRRQAGGRRAYF